ncbi:unnamed protein product, partial [Staurois parvus]
NRSKIRLFLTPDTTKQLIHSLIISRLDYCNSLLTGLPHHILSPLQLIHLTNRTVSATPPMPIPPLASTQCPPPPSANPSRSLHSVSSTPLCHPLYWPPLSVLHPPLPIPPLTSTQCPPPLSANPSTGLHSVSFIPLCQS